VTTASAGVERALGVTAPGCRDRTAHPSSVRSSTCAATRPIGMATIRRDMNRCGRQRRRKGKHQRERDQRLDQGEAADGAPRAPCAPQRPRSSAAVYH